MAIEKAKNLFPEIHFITVGMLKERPLKDKHFDLVVIKEVLWYVCHQLPQFLKNALDMVKENGFLYISQSFPENDKWVGHDVIDSPETLQKILSSYTKPLSICVEIEKERCKGQYVHYLGKHECNHTPA